MSAFNPRFTISHAIATGLTAIERARGFLEAATLSKGRSTHFRSKRRFRDRESAARLDVALFRRRAT